MKIKLPKFTCQFKGKAGKLLYCAHADVYNYHESVAVVKAANTSYVSSNLVLVINSSGNAVGLTNRLTGVNWITTPASVYSLSGGNGLTKTVSYIPLTNGEILVTRTLTNSTTTNIFVTPSFPYLAGLNNPGAGYGTLTYCFPQIGDVSRTATGFSGRYYGGDFPMQFMDAYNGLGRAASMS